MAILGIILLIIGAVLFFVQRNQKQKVFSIKSARPVKTTELTETASAVADEIGGGSWRDYIKLWGEVQADAPLTSDLKQQPCVHYVSKVTREYEETVTERNSEGELERKQKRASEVISNNRQSIPFRLKDDAGTIEVNPDGADIETIQVLNEFRQEQPTAGQISFGPVKFNVGRGAGKTLGYRYTESLLPLGRNVLVVGAASDLTGQVIVEKPPKGDKKYVISFQNEEALAAAVSRNAQISFFSMVGCFAVGAILLVVGLLS
ncbi:MAG: E3 ubiquitin ligase family protein [Cyanobacteria bacterium]|nr:E3 ubiquitin ligase family protein [Cyanobacteriota bacterium]MDA0867008.1 E3 ubiquitin ligase family protein [Cyanobacteriota bacterium]